MGKSKARNNFRVETTEEYIARGGSVKRIPEVNRDPQPDVVKKTTAGGPVHMMTLDEADLFYGEARKNAKPKKEKSSPKIDLNALPIALRAKFISKMKEDVDGEGYEEDLEEAGEENEDSDED